MKQLAYDAFQTLGKLSSAGKVVSAWILPSGDPTRYLARSGTNVISWVAACGTHPVDLAEESTFPQFDEALFSGKGGVTFDGLAQCLTGTVPPTGWPTDDLYMLAAVSQDAAVEDGADPRYALAYGASAFVQRAIVRSVDTANIAQARLGNTRITGSGDFSGAHTIGGVFGATSHVYLDGALDASTTTAASALTLTRVRMGGSPASPALSFWKGAIVAAAVLNATADLQDFLDLEAEFRARLA